MDTDSYLSLFIDESREYLQAINDHLLLLEKNPHNPDIISEIFRSAHTLKGMAASMGFEGIASVTHSMENVFEKIRSNQLIADEMLIDTVFAVIRVLEQVLDDIAEGGEPEADFCRLSDTLDEIVRTDPGKKEASQPGQVQEEMDEYGRRVMAKAGEMGYSAYQITVRLHKDCQLKGARAYMVFAALENCGEVIQTVPPVEELEEGLFDDQFTLLFLTKAEQNQIKNLLLDISEVQEVKMEKPAVSPASGGTEKAGDNPETSGAWPVFSKNGTNTIRVQVERIDELLNLFEELIIQRGRLETIAETLKNRELDENVEDIKRTSSQMQTLLLSLRMVPVGQVFNRFPRMVRELARELEKKVDLQIYGEDTELDRLVLDEIRDLLVHMIRNSMDHGIEPPEERRKRGKAEAGTLILRAYHSGNHVFIEIEDDGAGLNREKIAGKAVEKGLLTAEEAAFLPDEEIFQWVFASGFSTADKVSDVSGRGVGLDAVKNKIESLGGHLHVTSREGEGTIFSIQLPLTLSIISSLLVKVEGHTFAIPLSSIIRTYILGPDEILRVGRMRAMDLRGQVIPLIPLSEVLELSAGDKSNEETAVVVVKKGEQLAGLMVDSFIGQREIVIKSLGRYLGEVFGFSGATILGDGRIALVLDPNAFISQ